MERTTVYLTREMRFALKETAARRRVSEAELIREGVALVTADEPYRKPRIPLISSGDPTLAERVDEVLDGFGS
ncbi:MAG: CopG family transcriptional regulator [Chloroflexota bacterium]